MPLASLSSMLTSWTPLALDHLLTACPETWWHLLYFYYQSADEWHVTSRNNTSSKTRVLSDEREML